MDNFFDYFFYFLKDENVLIEFINFLCEKNTVIIFGGFVRDYLFNVENKYRDVDIVVDVDSNILETLIKKYFNTVAVSVNQFNGFKIQLNNISVDIWALKDTWAIKNGYFTKEHLLDTVYLNIDAYAFDLSTRSYIDNCDKKTLPNEIDICFHINPNEELNLIRCLVLSQKYKLGVSDLLKRKIINLIIDKNNIEKLQINHYGKVMITINELKTIVSQWRFFNA